MLYHPGFSNISIDTYKSEVFMEFMLADGVHINHSLN